MLSLVFDALVPQYISQVASLRKKLSPSHLLCQCFILKIFCFVNPPVHRPLCESCSWSGECVWVGEGTADSVRYYSSLALWNSVELYQCKSKAAQWWIDKSYLLASAHSEPELETLLSAGACQSMCRVSCCALCSAQETDGETHPFQSMPTESTIFAVSWCWQTMQQQYSYISEKCFFTSILFWHLFVPQLLGQLLAHTTDGDWVLLWLDQLCDLVWELDYRQESQIILAAGALLREENQWSNVLHPF